MEYYICRWWRVGRRELCSLVALAVMALMLIGPAPASAGKYVTIGSGSVTGVYYPVAGAIARIVNKRSKQVGLRVTVEATGGSTYNVNTMSIGELDMGIVQSDVGYRAWHGEGDFAGKRVEGLRSIFSLYPEPFHIITLKRSGIKTFADLKGKRVNIGNPGSGQRSTAEALFRFAPFGLKDITVESLKASEAPDYLRDGRIDAFFYTVGIGSASIMDIASAHPVHIAPVDESIIKKLVENRPYFVETQIPGGAYPGNPEPVNTFAVKATLMTTADAPDQVVYDIVKAVFENFDSFKSTHPALGVLTPQSMLKGLSAPIHQGARRYYKERGWIK